MDLNGNILYGYGGKRLYHHQGEDRHLESVQLEGLVLVVAVDTSPDVAKAIINVTGHMSVATLTNRGQLPDSR